MIVKGQKDVWKNVCNRKCNNVCGYKLKWKKGKLKKKKVCKNVCTNLCKLKKSKVKIDQSFNLLQGPSFSASNSRIVFAKGQGVGQAAINLAIRLQNKGKCKFNKWQTQIKAFLEIDLGSTSIKKGTGWINVALLKF